MTLIISKGLTLRNQLPADTEADAYIAAVEAADTAAGSPGGLEPGVKFAIKNFVLCCKQDGIWDAIKASCILAGARTLTGALVPLVGTAPTSTNFSSGDYNRKTGLVGNGSNKQLNTNRAASSDSETNFHQAVFASTVDTNTGTANYYLGATDNTNVRGIGRLASTNIHGAAVNFNIFNSLGPTPPATGILGQSRTGSVSVFRTASQNFTPVNTGTAVIAQNAFVFSRGGERYVNARLAFYSIGESLDLALLDARVTDLINAFAAAIP
jgi:hypothetical protein